MIILILLIFSQTIIADFLKLPEIWNNKPIFYVKSKQLNGWSCGYNVLFNACNLETFFGKTNKFSQYNKFNETVSYEISRLGYKPKNSSNSKLLVDLSKKLSLEKFCYLTLDKNKKSVMPFFPQGLRISYAGSISEEQKEQLFAKERDKQQKIIIDELKGYINKNNERPKFIHFCCHLNVDVEHAVLITLVYFNQQQAFYIFDNLNTPIHVNSQIMRYIDYIYNNFNKNSQVINVHIPSQWQSIY